MKIHQPVFLIGFMGSGKTYWGSRMAEKMHIPFYDLDALIESKESKTIPEIFAHSGEDGFRVIEREALHRCRQLDPAIVATGGGTPCFFDNMDWMNAAGRTIYLKTPASVLAERLKQERQFRPLLANIGEHDLETHIEKLLALREPFYNQANVILDQHDDEEAFLEQLLTRLSHCFRSPTSPFSSCCKTPSSRR